MAANHDEFCNEQVFLGCDGGNCLVCEKSWKAAMRHTIIELGRRGVIGASDKDTAIVDEICKCEGVKL